MQYRATHKFIRMTPGKARLVADLVRGQNVNRALELLKFNKKRGAYYIENLVKSAIANVSNTDINLDVNVDDLYLKEIKVDDGPRLKRWMARAQGRASRILKRSCHISVVLEEKSENLKAKKK